MFDESDIDGVDASWLQFKRQFQKSYASAEEEDERRKRRAYDAMKEKEERKAEHKKCSFCKRFSCIC